MDNIPRIAIHKGDNIAFAKDYLYGDEINLYADLIYCDMIYENKDLTFIDHYWKILRDFGIFIVQTDWHTDYLVRSKLENMDSSIFVNSLVWKNEFGNFPKDRFHQCHDDIIIYSKGKKNKWKFYPERIQINKVTAKSNLNPSGRQTKTATSWIDDICLTTISKERVKRDDGKCIPWQKPLKLFDRIISCFTDEGDLILDPFMGSGSLGEWCVKNKRDYIGIELDKEVFEIAKRRIESVKLE